jgi:hypothetical protein
MCMSDGNDISTVAPQCSDEDFDVNNITDDMQAMVNFYDPSLVSGNRKDLDLQSKRATRYSLLAL